MLDGARGRMQHRTIEKWIRGNPLQELGEAQAVNPKSGQLDRRSLDHRVADILRGQILSGALPPGHRLVETALAEGLAISRGTLRAALRALTHEGLVAQVAYTKWMVPELSPADAWELYTLRGSLEGLAARLVTERQRPEAIASVKHAFDRLESAVAAESHPDVAEADAGLHKTIVMATGHQRLQEQYHLLEQQIRRYILLTNAAIIDLSQMVPAHRPLVEAILVGDIESAARLAQEHNAPEVDLAAEELARHQAPKRGSEKGKRRVQKT
jgi:DNA-binding GntR family transcriptional regulator